MKINLTKSLSFYLKLIHGSNIVLVRTHYPLHTLIMKLRRRVSLSILHLDTKNHQIGIGKKKNKEKKRREKEKKKDEKFKCFKCFGRLY